MRVIKEDARSLRCPKRSEAAVADTGRLFEALQENQDRNFRELQEAIEHMSAKQNRLLATMERKHQLMNGASNEILRKFFKEVWVWEEKISEVENALHEVLEEMRTLMVERTKAEAEELRVFLTCPDSVWTGGQRGEPEALKVKLDLLERQDSGALGSSGSVWTREFLKGTMIL